MLWENAVRVSSERQTLILAGEAVPQRPVSRPFTLVATHADLTLLPAQNGAGWVSSANNPDGAAGAYARTQALAGGNPRAAIIDTYA